MEMFTLFDRELVIVQRYIPRSEGRTSASSWWRGSSLALNRVRLPRGPLQHACGGASQKPGLTAARQMRSARGVRVSAGIRTPPHMHVGAGLAGSRTRVMAPTNSPPPG